MKGAPDYGAFQTRVLVPAENAVPLPQEMGFNEASLLPHGGCDGVGWVIHYRYATGHGVQGCG
jgi:NADPH:quinone reductase-like Zn-dependent oxidoreductase